MANRWGNSGNSGRPYFLGGGSKITADGDYGHEIKRCLLLGTKAMTNLDSIIKSRDITLSTKVHLVKAMVFPVVMYGHDSWTIKKAESRRIDAFEVWCWRRPLRVLWTARRSNQSILKEISPECSLERLRLKLQLQSFGHLMGRADSFEKTLMLGKTEGRRRREQQRMRWLDGITDSMEMTLGDDSIGDGPGSLGCCSPWVTKSWTQLSDWTEVRDREAWHPAAHGVSKSWTGLSDWTTFLSKPAHTSTSPSRLANERTLIIHSLIHLIQGYINQLSIFSHSIQSKWLI